MGPRRRAAQERAPPKPTSSAAARCSASWWWCWRWAGWRCGTSSLQVLEHDEYATRSEANRIKLRPVVPARGLIYDRKGRMLADNVPAFRLDVMPEEAGRCEELAAGAAARSSR